MSSALAKAALELAGRGIRIVPLHPKAKRPRLNDWPHKATAEEETIAGWWEAWPDSNIGIALGPGPTGTPAPGQIALVDIEGDGPEAEIEAEYKALFGPYGIAAPTYQSTRGKHRLFRWRPDLPGGACIHVGALEIRTGNGGQGAQSVAPPSIHPSEAVYQWLPGCSIFDVDPPEIPDAVVAELWNRAGSTDKPKKQRNLATPASIPEGQRHDETRNEALRRWRIAFNQHGPACFDDPDIGDEITTAVFGYNARNCTPPSPPGEVQDVCRDARAFIQRETTREAAAKETGKSADYYEALGLQFRDGEWHPGQWHVETINSDPPVIRLHAPFLARPLDLNVEQFDSARKFHRAVLAATRKVALDRVPGVWDRVWKGKPARRQTPGWIGVQHKLLETAEETEAPAELIRHNIVAEFLWGLLRRACTVEEGHEPMSGHPWKDPQGNTWFSFTTIKQEADFERVERINRNDLCQILGAVGVQRFYRKFGTQERQRYMMLTPQATRRIEAAAAGEDIPGDEKPGAYKGKNRC